VTGTRRIFPTKAIGANKPEQFWYICVLGFVLERQASCSSVVGMKPLRENQFFHRKDRAFCNEKRCFEIDDLAIPSLARLPISPPWHR
jgi:hypothetical protein